MNTLFFVLITVGILAALAALGTGCSFAPYPVRWSGAWASNLLSWVMFFTLCALLVVIAGLFFLFALLCGIIGFVGYTLFNVLMKIPDFNYPSK